MVLMYRFYKKQTMKAAALRQLEYEINDLNIHK